MLDNSHKNLSQAILETVAYSDVFEYPLRAREIHRYLIGNRIQFEDLEQALDDERSIHRKGEFFILPGRGEIVQIRQIREAHSRRLLPHARQIGQILGALPFIRMVALTGSLAVLNVSKTDDFDYMLVTVPGRVWTARAFALLINRVVKLFGRTICPNLIVSEKALEWPLHDLYSARELCQMVPIFGMDVYRDLLQVNAWAADFLPNAYMQSNSLLLEGAQENSPASRRTPGLKNLLEVLLGGRLGDRFEEWEMNRKIRRFSQQAGFGEETVFNAQVCQGNFHHHRKWTHAAFQKRLDYINKDSSTPVGEQMALQQERLAVRRA